MTVQERNWAGNITFGAARLHHPETMEQLQALVSRSDHMRVLGSRHSFNQIADTSGDLVCLDAFAPAPVFDHERHTVTVSGGVTYGQLCRGLHREGYAIHNTASLPHITLAGACATATHGSGGSNGNLATAVAAMEFVAADGTVVALSRERDGERFAGAVVGLGGLGVVTRLTLDLAPTFDMRQDVYENLPLARLEAHFDALTAAAYSVSLFTDWQGEHVNSVWVKRRVADGDKGEPEREFFGATAALAPRSPLGSPVADNCTPQMGVVGPWHERLPHFRVESTPSSGDELQSEYFVPRPHAVAAFRVLDGLRAHLAPLLKVSEVRTIAADDFWMSPCYGRDCVALHFSWRNDWEGVRALLPLIEEQFAPFDPAPHWGKLFTMPAAQVQSRYAKLPEFRQLLHTYDPKGTFRNPFLDTHIFGS